MLRGGGERVLGAVGEAVAVEQPGLLGAVRLPSPVYSSVSCSRRKITCSGVCVFGSAMASMRSICSPASSTSSRYTRCKPSNSSRRSNCEIAARTQSVMALRIAGAA